MGRWTSSLRRLFIDSQRTRCARVALSHVQPRISQIQLITDILVTDRREMATAFAAFFQFALARCPDIFLLDESVPVSGSQRTF
ncbi:MAG: hypothetical protein DMF21_02260 [Verrucomicrobia bacterium]|nr:MAG: hypothetical protein DMF21_02260 [Verrucomicrobiota bacterium]